MHIAADSLIPSRKRSKDVIEAFSLAFEKEADVRLLVKKTPTCAKIHCFDRRVTLDYSILPSLLPVIQSSHVGVFLSGQEAWGYPHHELMATGRAVISPIYGGMKEFMDASCAYSLPYGMRKIEKSFIYPTGDAPFVRVKDLAASMRFCYENFDDVVLKGVLAYRKSLGFTISRMSARLNTLI